MVSRFRTLLKRYVDKDCQEEMNGYDSNYGRVEVTVATGHAKHP